MRWEISLYNALAGAQTPDGNWWSYFSPLVGQRVPSLSQYAEIGLSCCVANGPRSLLLLPRAAVMSDFRSVSVNLYLPGTFAARLHDGSDVTITQATEYPRGRQDHADTRDPTVTTAHCAATHSGLEQTNHTHRQRRHNAMFPRPLRKYPPNMEG